MQAEGFLKVLNAEILLYFEVIIAGLVEFHYDCSALYILSVALRSEIVQPTGRCTHVASLVAEAAQRQSQNLAEVELIPPHWDNVPQKYLPFLEELSGELSQLMATWFSIVLRDHLDDSEFWRFLEYLLTQWERQDLISYYLLNECFFRERMVVGSKL